jgi:hypothetical protein
VSYQNVDVYVLTRSKEPIPGVVVRVFDPEGVVFYTDTVTDVTGRACFSLWNQRYSLRFYKFATRFQQPQVIDVIEGVGGAPAVNAFNTYAEVMEGEVAVDPRLCRARGHFRDITGAPRRYLDVIFIGEFAPILLDGAGVLSERRMIRTDKSGYACLDLIRCAQYSATIEGYEDQVRKVYVPDAPSVNLPELLFPTVGSVSFAPHSPWTLSVGSTLELTPSVFTSTQVPLDGVATTNVRYIVEDPTIASISALSSTLLQLRGIKPGSTRLLVQRTDLSVITIPYSPEVPGSGASILVQ